MAPGRQGALAPGQVWWVMVLCCIFSTLPMFGLYALNFIAVELEDPFGTDDNDLPLKHFQTEMNKCLMMLLHPNADLMATIGDRCVCDFDKLSREVCLTVGDEDKIVFASEGSGKS